MLRDKNNPWCQSIYHIHVERRNIIESALEVWHQIMLSNLKLLTITWKSYSQISRNYLSVIYSMMDKKYTSQIGEKMCKFG